MTEKRIYSFELTVKSNLFKNYHRNLFAFERFKQTYNSIREENIISFHMDTENFDKYFSTRYNVYGDYIIPAKNFYDDF